MLKDIALALHFTRTLGYNGSMILCQLEGEGSIPITVQVSICPLHRESTRYGNSYCDHENTVHKIDYNILYFCL